MIEKQGFSNSSSNLRGSSDRSVVALAKVSIPPKVKIKKHTGGLIN